MHAGPPPLEVAFCFFKIKLMGKDTAGENCSHYIGKSYMAPYEFVTTYNHFKSWCGERDDGMVKCEELLNQSYNEYTNGIMKGGVNFNSDDIRKVEDNL